MEHEQPVTLKRIVTEACNTLEPHALMYVTQTEMVAVLCFMSKDADGEKTKAAAGTRGIQCGPSDSNGITNADAIDLASEEEEEKDEEEGEAGEEAEAAGEERKYRPSIYVPADDAAMHTCLYNVVCVHVCVYVCM